MIFETPAIKDPLSQGDILDACPIFGFETSGTDVDLNAAPARWQERVIVLTQACDLAQAKTTKVLVALLHPAQLLVERGILKSPNHPGSGAQGTGFRLVFSAGSPGPHCASGIDH